MRLWQICALFGGTSLLSFGGGNAIIPHLELVSVDQDGWITGTQFADAFAISQAAPGPSTLLVSLLGYQAAGLAGALLATASMVLPSSVVVAVVAWLWRVAGHARWQVALERGLAPVAIGLILSGGVVMVRATDHGTAALLLTVAATAVFCFTSLNPLLVLAGCGVAGWLGGL